MEFKRCDKCGKEFDGKKEIETDHIFSESGKRENHKKDWLKISVGFWYMSDDSMHIRFKDICLSCAKPFILSELKKWGII